MLDALAQRLGLALAVERVGGERALLLGRARHAVGALDLLRARRRARRPGARSGRARVGDCHRWLPVARARRADRLGQLARDAPQVDRGVAARLDVDERPALLRASGAPPRRGSRSRRTRPRGRSSCGRRSSPRSRASRPRPWRPRSRPPAGRIARIVSTKRRASSESIDCTSRSRSCGVRMPRSLRWSMHSAIRSWTRVAQHRELHAPVEHGAQEGVGVLERGRLGVQHQDAVVAEQEVVDHRGVDARAAVDHHDVAVEAAAGPGAARRGARPPGARRSRWPCVAAIEREVRDRRVRPAASPTSLSRPATKSARLAAGRGTPSQVCRFAPSRSVSTAATR